MRWICVAGLKKAGFYYLVVVWVVWSEVSYLVFFMDRVHVVGVIDVSVSCMFVFF